MSSIVSQVKAELFKPCKTEAQDGGMFLYVCTQQQVCAPSGFLEQVQTDQISRLVALGFS